MSKLKNLQLEYVTLLCSFITSGNIPKVPLYHYNQPLTSVEFNEGPNQDVVTSNKSTESYIIVAFSSSKVRAPVDNLDSWES